MPILYGVDTSKPVTPEMVRDAIVECFYQAHCTDSGIATILSENENKSYCREIVKKGFSEVGMSYDQPTKEALLKVVGYLVEFSKNFRDPSIVLAHKESIMQLINALP